MNSSTKSLSSSRLTDTLYRAIPFGRLTALQDAKPKLLLEVAFYTTLGLAASFALRSSDPFWTRGDYPWIWLLPTIMALRYGALLGLFSALVLLGLGVGMSWAGLAPLEFSNAFLAGGTVQALVVGHVRDRWVDLSNRTRGVNTYLREQLNALTTAHYLLRVSHERLERDLYTRPVTLRGAMERLREIIPLLQRRQPDEHPQLTNAQDLLELLGTLCQLDAAAIYPWTEQGRLAARPLACIGQEEALDTTDPILRTALERNTMTHLRNLEGEEPRHYLVAAPITSSATPLAGMLVATQMNFMSLHQDNLQLLQVLLEYYADSVFQARLIGPIQDLIPECPYHFGVELARAGHLRARFGVESSLVTLSFPQGGRFDAAFQEVLRQLRALDLYWAETTSSRQYGIFLLPLTLETEVDGYLNRINTTLKTHFDLSLEDDLVHTYTLPVNADNPVGELLLLRQMARASA